MVLIHGMEGAIDVCLSYGNYECNQSPPVFGVPLPSFCNMTANCPPLDDFDDGVRSGDSPPFYHNEQVSYTCNNGFTLVGSSSLTCDDGAWNDDQPVCLANCVVSAVPDSDYSSGGSVTHGTTFNVTCDSGFSTGTTRATEFSCNDGVLSPVTLPTCYVLPGVSILLPERVNPYQPSSFTCYARGNPVPEASSVHLYRRSGSNYNTTGITRRSSTVSGSERAVVFDVDSVYPQDFGGYQCRLYFENNTYYSKLITNATYVLPVLESKVEVTSTSTSVGLQWNAWSDGVDIGDPPLVGYDVFAQKDGKWVAVQSVDQPTTSAIVINLTSDTDYIFCVAAVREGTGGTGHVCPSNGTRTHCGKPSASPTGLQVAAINPKELEVKWEHLPTESAECRSGVTHYMIYYVSTGSTSLNSLMVPNDTSSYTLRGLETYLDYTIQLTASNKDEESDRSSETASKTIEEVAPAPINLTIPQITKSSFTVSWSTPLPSNINGNIQKYIIRFKRTDSAVDGDYGMEEVWTSAFDGKHTVTAVLPREMKYTVQARLLDLNT
ncbi:receptor-type tyrosine-protein phosphatase U [Strongylocentrotus purpuratus]|uniref:Uncharacterized protein n=1 Tax=Strongylocentrotus purpuratus TaxID=7668 RepID=A0A7M7N8W0_STRPU|nr:receptor-type tyrosine-protein phosphatase U [Strongylocentrotus purpuratus]